MMYFTLYNLFCFACLATLFWQDEEAFDLAIKLQNEKSGTEYTKKQVFLVSFGLAWFLFPLFIMKVLFG